MNAFSFIDLIHEIFKKGLPNLEKIEKKGLLAVKIAQTFALRIDFLDDETCTHLSKLYTSTTSIPEEDFNNLLHQYTDEDWRANFTEINPIPFASASIGQVHKGVLKDGRIVAIKILKADFKKQFIKDVKAVSRLFKLCIFFYPKLARVANPIGVLKSIEEGTLAELNFLNEIKNRDILFKIYEDNKAKFDLSKLHFINYHVSLSNESVAVSDLIEGYTYDHQLKEHTLPYDNLLNLFKVHGFYVFGIGTFHGDIHPGNIIGIGEDIYFVDCGAIGYVSEKMTKGLFNFMSSLSFYDYDGCAKYLNEMSRVEITRKAFANFNEKLLKIYDGFSDQSVSMVSLTKTMMETIKLGVNCGMDFGEGIYPIIKSMMYLDGMVIRCNPEALLMKDMRENIAILNPAVKEIYKDKF